MSINCLNVDDLKIKGRQIDAHQFMEIAEKDKPLSVIGQGYGVYQCFCQQQFSYENLVFKKGEQICDSFDTSYFYYKMKRYLITFGITFFDQVLR